MVMIQWPVGTLPCVQHHWVRTLIIQTNKGRNPSSAPAAIEEPLFICRDLCCHSFGCVKHLNSDALWHCHHCLKMVSKMAYCCTGYLTVESIKSLELNGFVLCTC